MTTRTHIRLMALLLAGCGAVVQPDVQPTRSTSGTPHTGRASADSQDPRGPSICELDRQLQGHTGPVDAIAFSPDGTLIATGSHDHTIRLWRREGAAVGELTGHVHYVRALAFTPDGQRLVSGGQDDSVRVWNVSDRTLEHTFHGQYSSARARIPMPASGHRGSVVDVDVHTHDGTTYVASASNDRSVRLWTLGPFAAVADVPGATMVTSLAFTEGAVVLADFDENITVYDLGTNNVIHRLSYEPGDHASEHLAALADGQVVTGGGDGVLRLWDALSGEPGPSFDTGEPIVVALARNGDTIASGHFNGDIILSSVRGRRTIARLPHHSTDIMDLAFSPDGGTLATSEHEASVVQLWRCTP